MAASPQQICFFDDHPHYGGHQVMACYGIEAFAQLRREFRPLVFYNPENSRLRTRLQGILESTGNLELRPTSLRPGKVQALTNFLVSGEIGRLTRELSELAPHRVICVQFDMEDACQGLFAARRAGCRTLSYIPVPHTLRAMGARLGLLRDVINRPVMRLPDVFVTISRSMENLLRRRGATQPIRVVPNGVDLSRFSNPPAREDARRHFKLPLDQPVLGHIGQIHFQQKQQDFLLRTFARSPEFAGCHLVIGGSGPDDAALDALLEELHLTMRVTRIPWIEHPEILYPALDALALPSRYEGVPLVMIEALACGVPVIGSDRDGMAELLPESWLFPLNSRRDFVRAWNAAQQTKDDLLPPLREKVLKECSLENFQRQFVKACTD